MKNFIWIAGILLVAAASYYFTTNKGEESKLRERAEIALEDISVVDKITIDNRDGKIVTLIRKDTSWYVDGGHLASKKAVDILLNETLSKIRIKGPVSKKAKSNVIRTLITTAKHIKVYSQGETLRDFYVGSATADMSGSYVHITGAETPYIAHILGYNSLLEPKFSTEKYDWYDRQLVNINLADMKRIKVVNNDLPTESFELLKEKDTYLMNPPMANLSQAAARSYFSLFESKGFEGFASFLTEATKDSIAISTPFMTLTVYEVNGDSTAINLFRKGSKIEDKTIYDKRGNIVMEDTERYFATFTGFDQLVTVQDYVFGKNITIRSLFAEQ